MLTYWVSYYSDWARDLLCVQYILHICIVVIRYVVPMKIIGTAYGISYMFFALSSLIGSTLSGLVVPKDYEPLTGYKKYSLIFIGCSIASSLLVIVVHYYDAHH